MEISSSSQSNEIQYVALIKQKDSEREMFVLAVIYFKISANH